MLDPKSNTMVTTIQYIKVILLWEKPTTIEEKAECFRGWEKICIKSGEKILSRYMGRIIPRISIR